jgi:glycosyltransferase involved in cell wall biosynthesis
MRPDEKSELHIRKRPHIGQCLEYLLQDKRVLLSANSEAGRLSYADWIDIPANQISVIHNGVDFEYLEEQRKKEIFEERFEKLGIKDGHKIIGGLFRLEPGKRVGVWLDTFEIALQEDERIRGIIVGGGRLSDTVSEWINNRGLEKRVSLIGPVSDVASWLEIMDVFLFTSVSEGLPNVIIEAQGFGVPVVSTDVGGVSEIVEDGVTGLVVESPVPRELANSIISVLEMVDEENKRDISSSTRENFSIEKMIDATEEEYRNHLSKKD